MTSLCRHLSAHENVNWVTTADGCVHTADADATKQFRRVGVGGVYWALAGLTILNNMPNIKCLLLFSSIYNVSAICIIQQHVFRPKILLRMRRVT